MKRLVLLLFLAIFSHATTTTKQPTVYNPLVVSDAAYSYVMGTIIEGEVYVYPADDFPTLTSVRIQPYGESIWYERVLIFCGNQAATFKGKSVFVVITYDRDVHSDYCYDILTVHTVNPLQ